MKAPITSAQYTMEVCINAMADLLNMKNSQVR